MTPNHRGAGFSLPSPKGRKIIAHGASRVEPVMIPGSPGTGRKILSLDGNLETPGAGKEALLIFDFARRPPLF